MAQDAAEVPADVQAEIPALEAPNAETLIGTVLGVLSNIQEMDVFQAIAGEIEVVIPENTARRDVLRLLRGRLNTVEFEDLPDVLERLTRVSQILQQHFNIAEEPPVVDNPPDNAPAAAPHAPAAAPPLFPPNAAAPAFVGGPLTAAHLGMARVKTEDDAEQASVDTVVRTLKLQRLNEFKIKGSIGDPGEKGKLDFGNLSYQIQGGKKRGYTESEICVGVVAAMTAGSELRSYLERVDDLTLEFLFKILRAHFKVQEAASMLAAMQNTVQEDEEALLKFCMKLMIMRDDVNLLSKQEPVPHDPVLVQSRFQHALYTGLQDSSVRQQLKYMLKKTVPPDAKLLEELSDIAITESVCQEKKKNGKKGKKKSESTNADTNVVSKSKKKEKEKPDPLIARLDAQAKAQAAQAAQIEKLTANVNNLTGILTAGQNVGSLAQVANLNLAHLFNVGKNDSACNSSNVNSNANRGGRGGNRGGRGGNNNNRRGGGFCNSCAGANVRYCNHCFVCGLTDHKRSECPTLALANAPEEKNE